MNAYQKFKKLFNLNNNIQQLKIEYQHLRNNLSFRYFNYRITSG